MVLAEHNAFMHIWQHNNVTWIMLNKVNHMLLFYSIYCISRVYM